MKLDKLLAEFYKKNGIPSDVGINKNTFEIKVLGINLKLLILIITSVIYLKK